MSSINIKYSVIIPHHNLSNLIGRCLDSIPTESTQIIVIDDNSDDDEKNNLKTTESLYPHVEFVYNNDGKGAGAARNIGISKAVGNWLIFVDADDFLENNTFDIWESVNNTNDDIIYFNVNCLDDTHLSPSNRLKLREESIKRLRNNPKQLHRWLKYCFTEPWGKLFNRRFVINNNISFQESAVANDYLFSVMTGLKAKSVSFCDKKYYNYLIRHGSLSNNQLSSHEKILSRLNVYFDIQNIFKQHGIGLRPFDRFANLVIKRNALSKDKLDLFLSNHNLNYPKLKVNSILSNITVLKQKIVECLNLPYCGF